MAKAREPGTPIETDVLIIGGGIAGLWAAARAKMFADRVTVMDKGPKDWGGLASMAGGDMIVLLPEEHVDEFMDDLVYYYEGLCEQDLVEKIFTKTYDRFKDYERLGHRFARDAQGRLKGVPQRGLSHIKCCLSRPFGEGGLNMVKVMVRELERVGVHRIGRTVLTDLLKEGERVIGAVGFNIISGEFCVVKAAAVILTTGVSGWKTSYGKSTTTGEGFLMAMRAGAEVRNFEFMKVWNVPRLFAWEGQTSLLPLGARFVNSKDEYFMERYSPKLGANTDPHYVVRAMAIEALEGRGPFFLDCSSMKPESVELMKPEAGWMGINYKRLKELGMDFFRQKLEWMPQLNEPLGGVIANLEGETGVPGLFAAGTARNIEAGVYIGGLHLATTAVTGYIAGESAARFAETQRDLPLNMDEIERCRRRLYAPLGRPGTPPVEVLREVQKAFFPSDVCILKNERSLRRALGKIQWIKKDLLPRTGCGNPHYLLKLIEVEGITRITELILLSSLLRTESRAGHFRADHPQRSEEWLRWIVARLDRHDEFDLGTIPIPVEKYRIKPTRYYSDQFTFPDLSYLLAS